MLKFWQLKNHAHSLSKVYYFTHKSLGECLNNETNTFLLLAWHKIAMAVGFCAVVNQGICCLC